MSANDTRWYKTSVIYELHIRAFNDSNADGIGDIPGLIEKLPYLQELGVDCLWLLPMYPSPLKDDGYDISEYFNIHPDYGTLNDFERLVNEAHKRGLRILTELVVNHIVSRGANRVLSRQIQPSSTRRRFNSGQRTSCI